LIVKRIVSVYGAGGVGAVVRAIVRRVRMPRARAFAECRNAVKDRTGIEIGGPSPIFARGGLLPLYPHASRIDNCNFAHQTIWEDAIVAGPSFRFDSRKAAGTQFISEGGSLRTIADGSYDFVLSSHMLEHTANPLSTLKEWNRLLSDDGALILVVPHRDGTFDHRRPVTTLGHLLDDFRQGTTEDDLTHVPEILELHDPTLDSGVHSLSFRDRAERNYELRSLHHHVFDTALVFDVLRSAQFDVLTLEPLLPYHIVAVARKRHPAQADSRFSGDRLRVVLRQSPFPTDRSQS
jgi:SAM-dependent methyltransferase